MRVFLFLLLGILLNAKIVDKIVAVINNEPITLYDLEVTMNKTHLDEKKALKFLIDQKIIESEIKKRGISVDDYEIEEAMSKIANKNNMSLFEFKNILMQSGELKQFKEKLKQNLLKEKLFSQIVNSKLKITPEEVKSYYETHKSEFSTFDTIQVTKYSANNPEILKNVFTNPYFNNKNIKVSTEVLSSKNLPLDKLYIFSNTKVNSFTPIVSEGMNYVTYYIVDKKGKRVLPFDEVKNIIANKLIAEKRNKILKDYFNHIKNRADIKIYN